MNVGDQIKIVDGPFSGMFGKIESIDEENKQVNAIVDLFGQETTIECELKSNKKSLKEKKMGKILLNVGILKKYDMVMQLIMEKKVVVTF